jgi:hypothetical protein
LKLEVVGRHWMELKSGRERGEERHGERDRDAEGETQKER